MAIDKWSTTIGHERAAARAAAGCTQLPVLVLVEPHRAPQLAGAAAATLGFVVMTLWDQARRDRNEAWRRIRVLRSAPPALVQGDRGPLYSSALEQAQQQFGAAERVAVESRAINLFYGLSQAGRALACAYAPLGEQYELAGHGIFNPGLDQATVEAFPDIAVRRAGGTDSSFRRLSGLLESPDAECPIPLRGLWPMLVEPLMHGHGLPSEAPPVLVISGSRDDLESAVLVSFPRHLLAGEPDKLDLVAFARMYPALDGATIKHSAGSGRTAAGVEQVHYYIQFRPGLRPLTMYRGDEVVMPAPAGAGHELHPVMVWWAILFTLSMLTRYRPKTWADIVDVDSSAYAVPTEFLLDAALDSVPDLLAFALDDAPTS